MKTRLFIFSMCLLLLIFCSCDAEASTASLDCGAVSKELVSEISGGEDYIEYDDVDVAYFPFASPDTEISMLYSRSADDIGEIGVLKTDSYKIDTLKKSVEEYLSNLKNEKAAFLRNYAPVELSKLDDACVKRYGNYIVFAVLSYDESEKLFNKAEEILK